MFECSSEILGCLHKAFESLIRKLLLLAGSVILLFMCTIASVNLTRFSDPFAVIVSSLP